MSNLNNSNLFYFTSESVANGHPDKVADQISDAVLDTLLAQDPNSRVAAETLVTTNLIVLAGEITTHAKDVDYAQIARDTVNQIGYNDDEFHFNANTCEVQVRYGAQSPNIAQGVDETENHEQGAGDQGLMFGFACDETPNFMPLAIDLSHQLMQKHLELRTQGGVKWMRPDAKTQVTIGYDRQTGRPVSIEKIVLSTQHSPNVSNEEIKDTVINQLIKPTLPSYLDTSHIEYLINPTGRFEIGGPHGDCGLTGRKIIVDTYGGAAPHGGGAFSGKDPSKVDRSAAYAARHVAKNIVASGLARQCQVQIAYAIGVAQPVSINVDTFGTGVISDFAIEQLVVQNFDLRPKAITKNLNLLQAIYLPTASFGHFGRTSPNGFTWERLDMVDILKCG